jgi:hypothetical protein
MFRIVRSLQPAAAAISVDFSNLLSNMSLIMTCYDPASLGAMVELQIWLRCRLEASLLEQVFQMVVEGHGSGWILPGHLTSLGDLDKTIHLA